MNASTAAKAIAAAEKGEANLSGLYVRAYSAAMEAVEAGVSLRDLAEAVKAEGIKANKDTMGDYAMAASLVVDPQAWAIALEEVYPGQIRRAHSLVQACRTSKGRGVGKAGGILSATVGALPEDASREDRVKAIAKALRALKAEVDAAKAEAKAAAKAAKAESADAAEAEAEEAEDAETPEADPVDRGHALALALVGPANALAKALAQGDAILTEADRAALMGALAALVKVVKAA
jgi:electron transport complex protein RnfC